MSSTATTTPARPLSQSPILFYLGYGCAALSFGLGFNAIFNPASALSWFEMPAPSPSNREAHELYRLIMSPYGARNIYAGVTMLVSAYQRQGKSLGAFILAFAGVAVVDGIACWQRGQGEWNHFCYVPQLVVLSSFLLGAWDGKTKTA
jgi:hypothetical protein